MVDVAVEPRTVYIEPQTALDERKSDQVGSELALKRPKLGHKAKQLPPFQLERTTKS